MEMEWWNWVTLTLTGTILVAAAAAAAHERAQQHGCRKYHRCLFCNYHCSFYLRIYWLIPYYAERGRIVKIRLNISNRLSARLNASGAFAIILYAKVK